MNRIMVIGCCGSGKSTLSRQLHKAIGIPLYHLDQYYWKPNWVETPKEEWKSIVLDLANKAEWIIDGNYGGTMDIRLKQADTIIFMDISTVRCLYRVLKRIWKYHGKVRPDMPERCRERLDFYFLHYVASYNMLRRKRLLKMLEKVKNHKEVHTIRNNRDISVFLSKTKNEYDV